MNIIYIVAGNHNEFDNYRRKKMNEYYNGVGSSPGPSNPPEYRYVHSIGAIRGITEIKGYYIGTWRNRADIDEVKAMITIIKSRSVGFTAQEIANIAPGAVI